MFHMETMPSNLRNLHTWLELKKLGINRPRLKIPTSFMMPIARMLARFCIILAPYEIRSLALCRRSEGWKSHEHVSGNQFKIIIYVLLARARCVAISHMP